MLAEINNLIDFKPGDRINGWFIGMSDSGNDGSFLIHHYLSNCLKNSKPVCFVALSQSFGHYNTVSQKFGTNLVFQKDSSKLIFIEGLKFLSNLLESDCDKADNLTNVPDKEIVISNIYTSISNAYQELKEKNGCNPTIIIDNVTLLITLGICTRNVIGLCHYLHQLTQNTEVGENEGNVILYCNNGKLDGDDDLMILWNWMCHSCTSTIEISGLASGYCKDVHGEIIAVDRKSLISPGKETRMQYKLSDKGITMFAAGMSSAVL